MTEHYNRVYLVTLTTHRCKGAAQRQVVSVWRVVDNIPVHIGDAERGYRDTDQAAAYGGGGYDDYDDTEKLTFDEGEIPDRLKPEYNEERTRCHVSSGFTYNPVSWRCREGANRYRLFRL